MNDPSPRTVRQVRGAAERAAIFGVPNTLTVAEWVAILDSSPECKYCRAEFSDSLRPTLDHVLAMAKGGANTAANVVAACWGCNVTKNRNEKPNGSKSGVERSPQRVVDRRHGAILVMLTRDDRARLDAAAKHAGLRTGPWIRMVALEAARRKHPESTSKKREGDRSG